MRTMSLLEFRYGCPRDTAMRTISNPYIYDAVPIRTTTDEPRPTAYHYAVGIDWLSNPNAVSIVSV